MPARLQLSDTGGVYRMEMEDVVEAAGGEERGEVGGETHTFYGDGLSIERAFLKETLTRVGKWKKEGLLS